MVAVAAQRAIAFLAQKVGKSRVKFGIFHALCTPLAGLGIPLPEVLDPPLLCCCGLWFVTVVINRN